MSRVIQLVIAGNTVAGCHTAQSSTCCTSLEKLGLEWSHCKGKNFVCCRRCAPRGRWNHFVEVEFNRFSNASQSRLYQSLLASSPTHQTTVAFIGSLPPIPVTGSRISHKRSSAPTPHEKFSREPGAIGTLAEMHASSSCSSEADMVPTSHRPQFC